MASTILLGVVTAVTTTITAGQQHAFEAQVRVSATLAAEALLGRVLTEDYDDIDDWDGYIEAPGAMVDEHDNPMPDTFGMIGREVTVTESLINITPPNVNFYGQTITVRAFDNSGRELIELTHCVAEPNP